MNEQNDKLDHLLREWDEQSQPDEDRLAALRKQISASIAEDAPADKVALQSESDRRTAWRPVVWRVAAAAAVIGLAVFVWRQQPRPVGPYRPSETPQFVRLETQQLAGQAKLLAEMEQVFAGQFLWVAETDGKVRMGLEGDPASPGGEPLSIRVVLARREEGGAEWTQLWAVDIMSRSQRVVRLDPETEEGVQISFWTYVLPDGMIAVDSSLSAGSAAWLKANSNNLQQSGEPAELLSRLDDGTEYRVFQTVALLNEA